MYFGVRIDNAVILKFVVGSQNKISIVPRMLSLTLVRVNINTLIRIMFVQYNYL